MLFLISHDNVKTNLSPTYSIQSMLKIQTHLRIIVTQKLFTLQIIYQVLQEMQIHFICNRHPHLHKRNLDLSLQIIVITILVKIIIICQDNKITNQHQFQSPELSHEITTNSPLKILIDSGASSSIMNPEIAYKLFSKFIFLYEFEIESVHKTTKGTTYLNFLNSNMALHVRLFNRT